jgi:two-component system chemotaxis sensor kinase CheA
MSDVIDTFIHESEEDLTQLNNALLALEDDPGDAEAIDEVFRVSHTLKGNCGAMGFPDAAALAHVLEDMLDEVREGRLSVTGERMDLLFQAVDHLEMMLAEIDEHGESQTDPTATVEAIRASIDDADGETDAVSTESASGLPLAELRETDATEADALYHVHVEVGDTETKRVDAMFVVEETQEAFDLHTSTPSTDVIEDGEFESGFDLFLSDGPSLDAVEEHYADSRYVQSVTVTDVTDELADRPTGESVEGATDTDQSPGGTTSDDVVESVRVDVDTIDELYNQVEEMVTSRIKLRNIIEGSELVEAEEEMNEHDKITSRIQDTVLEMRLVPLRKIVGNFPRLVRDLARDQDKEIDFQMEGTDIEMDRSILNEMRDPLVHLLRNAVDHGIEPPEEREAAGKPREGTIELRGHRERDRVTITVEDDGGGLDVEEIREKAATQDVMSWEELEVLDDSEVYDLIFHPGFSTTEEVTDVSGRGVGMDVVNRIVKRVDGSINVESEPGEGTAVTLTLPVSVAIVRVLFVMADGEKYGIPIKNIDEISELADVNVKEVEGTDVITHDDRIYPVIDVGEALNVPEAEPTDDDMVVRVKEHVRQVAIRCNDVVGQEEVVIKPFEGALSGTPGISGASVLGEGEVVMMLDVETV